ncbi:insulinase family protein [Parabacteroides sp. 52]|uniref:M16 family metallopeptidase n=1 Tax=unclassified Parabacteroides TaxID=2649774 RepID=UPI0013D35044|nr:MULTISPECIES: M16 family metallopeptidase [unclassified Parabacteroides]MDH6535591.1 putative Zn-dependent peptidase [Parabacteroides sp. PM5-20]NDV55456.1 insulinase family protein [Parabacteroides sp. 52]
MRNSILLLSLAILLGLFSACGETSPYKYESVPNDPMKARIYTLDNGLKVYMTVNKETPRIQTYVAVRVGGKNDPAETTGLAHYFEHLMFKGTEQFGTQNYEQEKPLLDEIERLFEVYRKTTDEAERKAIYKQIDSVSYEASKFSIPNEYDKLMSSIGAKGTNAYTSFDQTVYQEDIPSNQIENWAKIQSDRFKNNVIRGFHTELETVYEEKNMSLTSDGRKVSETLLSMLFPDHPYGLQTVLGTQEHLKNPSITNIKNYYKTWYVPNNMAICLSGDFDPEEMIRVIDTYFGDMQANPNLPAQPAVHASPLKEQMVKEVLGLEAANINIGWRMPGASSPESDMMILARSILNNGKAGLLDVNLNQQQKVLSCYAGGWTMADHTMFMMNGRPKSGQTLDEVKALLLEQVDKLKKGDFDEELLEATINNYKLGEISRLEYNTARASMFLNSFINNIPWEKQISQMDRLSKITKQDVVDFANAYFTDNYAVVYKQEGKDPNELKIEKPTITPIETNRDKTSEFLAAIQATEVKPIEPVFIDFEKDMQKLKTKNGIEVLYKQNQTNDIFSLLYVFDMGNNHDKAMGTAFEYMKYLGTSTKSLQQINEEFYKLACYFGVSPGSDRTYVTLEGLAEKMPQAMELFEELLADAQVNAETYANLSADILKRRADGKLNQSQNFNKLIQYAIWGPQSPTTHVLSTAEIQAMNPQELVDRIHKINSYEHKILYYGPDKTTDLLATIEKYHRVPETLNPIPAGVEFVQPQTAANNVLLAQYDAKQIYFSAVSNRGESYDQTIQPTLNMYNEYFGGGMNAIVFQEMREARGLAYSAGAFLITPSKLKYPYIYRTFIATQNDKMIDAMKAFDDIINNMPESEKAFNLAKDGLITRMRTERVTKSNILWSYLYAQDMGRTDDGRKRLYEEAQTMTLADVKAFQEKWVKGRTYTYCVLGDEKELDLKALSEYGPIKKLSKEDIFGY